ncbi:thioredoxin family protein [Alkalihalobacillus pseudalcaliphilus]|uniref:thioredoxin family protein n=1 Tax=Alkalihalobacillus pseudalcaliphilus TaxID=79884 RepID=UPI00235FFB6B|nr:thioredoxin family protein [Alkalihalobacillus pseudalcaliphilus]
MSHLMKWFDKGMSEYQYIEAMSIHQERLLKVYNEVEVSEGEKRQLKDLQNKHLKAVILTADWCGDAMVNLPILMRFADEALIETRYLIRDDNLELMDQYLTNGTARSIPIVVFLNQAGEEVAKWGPRAAEVQDFVEKLKEELEVPTDKEDPQYDAAFKSFIQGITEEFSTNEDIWKWVKRSLLDVLAKLK